MLYSDNNITFNYEEAGTGPPMLILHGNGPDHKMMMGCMEPIMSRQEGYRRIYVDLPGMGKTPSADWIKSSDDMLRAVEMMIEALIPGERFLLVGQSYGGYLARGLHRNYADLIEGVFLLCPCVIADMADRELPSHQVMFRDNQLLDELTEAEREEFTSITVVQSRQVWERYKTEIISALQLADVQFMQRIKESGGYPFSFDLETLAPFTKPSLILTGRQDSMTGFKDAWNLLDAYPHAAFSVLDRAGHNLHLEQEELLGAMVIEWLNRVKAGTIDN
ncbi:2-hydroxy-6-oxo-6-(2'-aminophenyl)hexa-2, 4-dienoic acid hydrolase [Paenibacillus auburnensis]|uniref:2-hydroxy-6-oxo-6-(2'-aminophenyl)hexa-2, 4-dienoic acid hydrolase n=1 Tax=Paenibacillus auburnensis TaxID=2905649 RepID=A0ABM9CM14_9BACL|nr:alpha/beta hydrolase [Paenibacillus auburnensis]CAH1217405.1 2-hydroxy-6-oxo-6-(2'-aminophenyl)hexa-2, 4-dienoic acid hydrolase [Paenibacillus auburnensis]